jgi:hypothetical protein
MTKAERRAVAKTLREWAAWCEANSELPWWHACSNYGRGRVAAWSAAAPFVDLCVPFQWYDGPTAATGLLLAAAMVEAGDSV